MTRQMLTFSLNGTKTDVWGSPSDSLLDVLHDELGLGEVRYGCGEGVCGTCTVLLDGDPVNACLTFAVQIQGHEITTLRGIMGDDGSLHPIQECFLKRGASQCGFCTPGMLLVSLDLVRRNETLSREEIRYGLVGNLCRCTGYTKIIDAVEEYAGSDAATADREGLES